MVDMSSYHFSEDLSSLHVAYSYLLQYLNISNHDVNDCRCVVVIWTVCYTDLLGVLMCIIYCILCVCLSVCLYLCLSVSLSICVHCIHVYIYLILHRSILVGGNCRIWLFCACAMKTYAMWLLLVAESPKFLYLIGNRGRGSRLESAFVPY